MKVINSSYKYFPNQVIQRLGGMAIRRVFAILESIPAEYIKTATMEATHLSDVTIMRGFGIPMKEE